MLSSNEYQPDDFERMIASEAINLKKLISTKDNLLRNAVTLKDITELKSYVRGRLSISLEKEFNPRELTQFLDLLDQTVLSDE